MANTIFTGSSRYATDFQSVISRAVAIATLPVTQLSQGKLKLDDQAKAFGGLQTTFNNLKNSFGSLSKVLTSGSLATSSSSPGVASGTIAGAVIPGVYAITVTDAGSFSSALSTAGVPPVTDPTVGGLTAATSLTLNTGGSDITITPVDTSLSALAAAINGANAGVQATMVNLGTTAAPDYRLSVQSTSLGSNNISLNDGTTELMSSVTLGSQASYTVNGQPSGGISSTSQSVTVAPGLTVDLKTAGSTSISVTRSNAALQNSITSLVSSFNAAITALDGNRGQSGGALAGDSTVYTIGNILSTLGQYTSGSSGISSLSDLGITFDSTGRLQFDATVVSGFDESKYQQAATFLGTDGTNGFLGAASRALDSIANTTDGVIQSGLNSVNASIKNQQALIDSNQERVDEMEKRLTLQLNAADALIASLEQQVTYFDNLFNATFFNNQK